MLGRSQPIMEIEREVLDILLEDARASTSDIARMTGSDEETVMAAIENLESDGRIRGFHTVVDWDRSEIDRARAIVELNVTLDRETSYDDISRRLSMFSEVKTLQLVSGDFDFHALVEADSVRELSKFISEKIAPVPEITQTVTHFVMDTYKERGIDMTNSDDDDDRLSVSP